MHESRPQDSGEAEADVNDLSLSLNASLETEPPSFHLQDAHCTVGSVEFKFRAGALRYNNVSHIMH